MLSGQTLRLHGRYCGRTLLTTDGMNVQLLLVAFEQATLLIRRQGICPSNHDVLQMLRENLNVSSDPRSANIPRIQQPKRHLSLEAQQGLLNFAWHLGREFSGWRSPIFPFYTVVYGHKSRIRPANTTLLDSSR